MMNTNVKQGSKYYALIDEKHIPENGVLEKFGYNIVQVFDSLHDRNAFCKDNVFFVKPLTAREAIRKIKDDLSACAWCDVKMSRSDSFWAQQYCDMLSDMGFDVYMMEEDDYRHM